MNDLFGLLIGVAPIAAFLLGMRTGENSVRASNRTWDFAHDVEKAKTEEREMLQSRAGWVTHRYKSYAPPAPEMFYTELSWNPCELCGQSEAYRAHARESWDDPWPTLWEREAAPTD